jgi:hypothetical protein
MYRDTKNYENVNRLNFMSDNEYGIPEIEPTQIVVDDFVGFNEAMSSKKKDCGVHFFLDDYQFNRCWNAPDKYIPILQKYKCVLSPDFSLYADFPKAIQIYNHYRKHWLGAYWQLNGIEVIPTICWSDKDSFEWCFDGEPVGGTVAVSSVGTQRSAATKELFLAGYQEMMKKLKPTQIIFYGSVPQECEGNIIKISAFQDKFRREE